MLVDLSAVENLPAEVSWRIGDVWRPGQGVLCAQILTVWLMASTGGWQLERATTNL